METVRKGAKNFVGQALEIGAIELVPEGRKLKSGRISPYFFNSGLFNRGASMDLLAEAYVWAIINMDWKMQMDVIFGPAYKGIPLAVAVSMKLYKGNILNIGYAFNRKEEKDHGEGGTIVGCSVKDKKVLIVDDVMTTGTSSGEAVNIVRMNGGIPIGCVIAFDRQERGIETNLSAVQEFEKNYGIPVLTAATLADLIEVLKENTQFSSFRGDGQQQILEKILEYQNQYGV